MPARFVTFRIEGGLYALAADGVERIFSPGEAMPLPGAPATLRGLAPHEGRLVALVDGPALLGAAPAAGALSALALAAPRQGIAILVPAPVEVDEGEPLSGAIGAADLLLGAGPAVLVDAAALIDQLTRAVVAGHGLRPGEQTG